MTHTTPHPIAYRTTHVLGTLALVGILSACASQPAPIVTPRPNESMASPPTQAVWQGAPTPTPTLETQINPTNPSNSQYPSSPASVPPTGTPAIPIATQPNPTPLEGIRVAVDPGHNGGNFNNTKTIARKVPDGRGGEKACNTTGTATANGYRESTFNWEVAQKLKATLESRGATVALTRDSDNGVGPCVDQRGATGNEADVLVSIHANGSDNPATRGWFLLYAAAPLNPQQGEPSRLLAGHLAETLKTQGFPTNPAGPYSPRNDIATINHSGAPVVMLELLEMKNKEDAALAQDPAAQQRYATAIADGVTNWVLDPRRTQ